MDVEDFTSALSQTAEQLLNIGPEDIKSVMKHYGVSSEVVSDMVSSVREWLKKQPHLPEDKVRDKQIIGYLMFRGFSVETVKRTLDDYFTAWHRIPNILRERDPWDQKLASYIKQGFWIVMPQKTSEDHRVTIFRMIPSENVSASMVFKIAFMFMDYRIWNDASLGDRWIIDLENVGLNEILQMTPVMISNLVFCIVSCFGARLKSLHIINVPSFAVAVVHMVKKLIKSKLAERVFVATKEDVLNIFTKNCLPTEYDGDGGSCQEIADKWCKTIQSDAWRQFFIEQNNMLIWDESSKKGLTSSSADDIFGADGSFRTLSID